MKFDADHPHLGRYEYVVRDVDEPDLGIQAWNGPETTLKSRGFGELKSQASDEIEARLDFDQYVGEHVATVWIDVDAWDYAIYWEVETPILQRLRQAVRRVTGGRSP